MSVSLVITTATEILTTYLSVAFVKPAILYSIPLDCRMYLVRFFLTEILIYSFNNNDLKKYSYGKAY